MAARCSSHSSVCSIPGMTGLVTPRPCWTALSRTRAFPAAVFGPRRAGPVGIVPPTVSISTGCSSGSCIALGSYSIPWHVLVALVPVASPQPFDLGKPTPRHRPRSRPLQFLTEPDAVLPLEFGMALVQELHQRILHSRQGPAVRAAFVHLGHHPDCLQPEVEGRGV